MDEIDHSPLNQRAWVLQERLLAPSTLHFTERQLYWECREQYASEVCPQSIPEQIKQHFFSKQSLDPCKISQERRVEACYTAWERYVGLYSRCDLTCPEDKLVALAGIARRTHESLLAYGTTDVYLAGLWRDTLLSDLLWCRSRDSPRSSRFAEPYRAPTWSWASLDGEVFMGSGHLKAEDVVHAAVVSAYTTTSIDLFGAVSAGAIDICAPLLRVQLGPGENVHGFFENGYLEWACPNFDFVLQLYRDCHEPYNYEIMQAFEVHALPLFSLTGLLLQPVTPGNAHLRGTFTRCGWFTIEYGDGAEAGDVSEANLKASEVTAKIIKGHEDPDLIYNQRREDGMCLVTII